MSPRSPWRSPRSCGLPTSRRRECGHTVHPPGYDGARQWGGHPDGLIPPSAMCGLGGAGHALRCDAAAAYRAMSAAYAAASGGPIWLTDPYRTYGSQVVLYGEEPALAAVPGAGNHGWGLAVDLCGGIQTFGTPQYAWMVASAGRFGASCTRRGPTRATGARSPGTGSTPGADGRGGNVGGRSYRADDSWRRDMLIDCDTCTVRGAGCGDCVVTVLLGAPPGWEGVDPVVVPMAGRTRAAAQPGPVAEDVVLPPPGVVVEFDEIERRAVRALAEYGLVPPLRHRGRPGADGGGDSSGRRTG